MTTTSLAGDDLDADVLNTAFSLLTSPRRRSVVRYLQAHPSATVEDLAGHLARREAAATAGDDAADDLPVQLRHVHLPKLDDGEVLTYDRSRDHVRRRETTTADVTFGLLEAASRRAN